jgi:hypothetical protein
MGQQIGRLARDAAPAQVILVGTCLERYLSHAPRNDRRLFGLDHSHCDVCLTPQVPGNVPNGRSPGSSGAGKRRIWITLKIVSHGKHFRHARM